MTTKFTKGPWRFDAVTLCVVANTKVASLPQSEKGGWPNRAAVADVCRAFYEAEHEANAHLIAAAPDLYEALEGVTTELSAIMDMAPGNRHNAEVFDKIDVALTALSKARGEAS